jgi:hypothetical protein
MMMFTTIHQLCRMLVPLCLVCKRDALYTTSLGLCKHC